MPLIGDGIADDTGPIQTLIDASGGSVVELPAGRFRITQDLKRRAAVKNSPGVQLIGKHPLATTIVADYNGDVNLGAMIRLDTSVISCYTMNSRIENLTLEQAPGRTGINGIQLTASWWVNVKNVHFKSLSGNGIISTLRPDIHPTISDFYQAFAVNLEDLYIRQCKGWGVKFAAGQSPGCYKLERSMIWGCASGGIMSTTGQCQIVGNAIAECGSVGVGGGILFDTSEGPNMVADVRQNEIDCNWNYGIWLNRTRGIRVTENRFLSATVESPGSWTRLSGSPHMRQQVHCKIGAPGKEVIRALFEQNLHRSVTQPNPTTATVIAYQNNGGEQRLNRIWYNDIDHIDGINQNSSGMIKFSGFTGDNTSIIDGSLVSPPATDIGTVIAKARSTIYQDVYGTITAIRWNSVDLNLNSVLHDNGYYFIPKVSGDYQISFTVKIKNLTDGQPVKLEILLPASSTILFTKIINATDIIDGESFSLTSIVNFTVGMVAMFCVTVPWPSKPLDISVPDNHRLEIRKL